MWNKILDKLARLKALDRQYQAFGARTHRYHLQPCLSEAAINEVERRRGVALPPALRSFYAAVGDGIAGPDYGLNSADCLKGHRADEPYPGVEVFRQIAAAQGEPPDESGYFEMAHRALSGLLSIIDQGCGHQTCLIAAGPKIGRIVYVSADGFVVETDKTLPDIYDEWLNHEIELFETVERLMRAGKTLEQIKSEMIARFKTYDAGNRMTSIADASPPASLDGARQVNSWYESVLADWQRKNR